MRRVRLRPISAKQGEFIKAWRDLRKEIMRRDHGRCRFCGDWGLEIHHVVKRSRDKRRRLERDVLVTLCRDCHNWTDEAGLGRRGRLVITALGGERFQFHIQETDKFMARALGRAADARGESPTQDPDYSRGATA